MYLGLGVTHLSEHLVPKNMSDIASNDWSLLATLVIQLILLVMMALKTLHLIRVFENQGMLVQLLLTCLSDITLFLMYLSYFMFIIFQMYILAGASLGERNSQAIMTPFYLY